MAEVKLDRLTKRYRTADVITDLTLTVRDGELFTIVGPSGCGKSTLLHLIAGLERPSAGRILFDDQDVTFLQPRARDVALVFQSYALYPHMTVAENLAFPLKVTKRKTGIDRAAIDGEVRRVADLLGLIDVLTRRPRELSGGQRQRVALGRALIRQPRVFLLDEPLSNLDAQLRSGMRAELRRLHAKLKTTMIYVTHDQTEAMTLADRVAVLHLGRLQQVGTPDDLYHRPANSFVALFIGQPPINLIDGLVVDAQVAAGPIRLFLPATDPAAPEALAPGCAVRLGIRPEDIRVSRQDTDPDSGLQDLMGTVRLIEPMGSQTWVTCEMADGEKAQTVIGLLERETQVDIGSPARLSIGGARVHLFHPSNGVRLATITAPPAESALR